jgi:hypothetical protein
MKVKNNAGEIIEVTETAYEILYKHRGFEPVEDDTSSKKQVKKNGRSKQSE